MHHGLGCKLAILESTLTALRIIPWDPSVLLEDFSSTRPYAGTSEGVCHGTASGRRVGNSPEAPKPMAKW